MMIDIDSFLVKDICRSWFRFPISLSRRAEAAVRLIPAPADRTGLPSVQPAEPGIKWTARSVGQPFDVSLNHCGQCGYSAKNW